MQKIPETAFLYKEGLYVNEYTRSVGKHTWTIWELFAADGYCFYDLQTSENYDDDSELRPAVERTHYKYMKMPKDEEYVKNNIFAIPCTEDIHTV